MKNKFILSLVLMIAVTCTFDAEAQYKRRKRTKYGYRKSKSKKFSKYSGGRVGYSGVGNPKFSTVGLSLNTTSYFGDLSPDAGKFSTDYLSAFIPDGVGLTYSKVVYPGIFLRGGFNWGRIHGTDYKDSGEVATGEGDSERGRYARNFHFRNDILELSAGLELDLIPSNGGARGRFPINPYLFVGVAGFYHSPKAIAPEIDQAGNPTGKGGEWVNLHDLKTSTESYSKFQFAVPIGLGCKFKVARSFDINLEFGFRYLFTDFIDDVGGKYKNLDDFGDNHLARALSERGAEQFGYVKGDRKTRETSLYVPEEGLGQTPVSEELLNSGNWQGNNVYTVGENYDPGNENREGFNRGGKTNDFLVMTQIRLVYILDKKGMSKGKFR